MGDRGWAMKSNTMSNVSPGIWIGRTFGKFRQAVLSRLGPILEDFGVTLEGTERKIAGKLQVNTRDDCWL